MGGAALHFGWVAEMKTGEGKTLVSTLPAYLNGARRQGRPPRHGQRLPGPLPRRVDGPHPPLPRARGRPDHPRRSRPSPAEKRPQYAADITYGTNNEFGFDYLRDNMAGKLVDKTQRGHNYAIVDEVDSILIDEARTPLIISGRVADAAKLYYRFASIVRSLQARRGLRGRGGQARRRAARGRHRQGRGGARRREHLRRGAAEPRPPDAGRAEGQGAVQAGQGLHHPERRGEDRRRVHRPHPRGPALERGHPPGRRGQGGREDQGGEPDPRHDHAAELLPHVRQARRDDRHGRHRGGRADEHLRARRRADPDQHAGRPRRPGRPDLQGRGRPSSTPSPTTSPSATQAASRSSSARSASRRASTCRASCSSGASPTRCSTPSSTRGRR